MEFQLKAKSLLVVLGCLVASSAFAECKSVMGTCVKQELVNSAPHMHAEYVAKTKVVKAPAPTATNTVSNKSNKKVNSTGVFSTMQKTAAQ